MMMVMMMMKIKKKLMNSVDVIGKGRWSDKRCTVKKSFLKSGKWPFYVCNRKERLTSSKNSNQYSRQSVAIVFSAYVPLFSTRRWTWVLIMCILLSICLSLIVFALYSHWLIFYFLIWILFLFFIDSQHNIKQTTSNSLHVARSVSSRSGSPSVICKAVWKDISVCVYFYYDWRSSWEINRSSIKQLRYWMNIDQNEWMSSEGSLSRNKGK